MGDKGKAVAVMAGLVAVSGVVFAGVILGAITMWSHNRQIQEAGKRSDAVVTAEALDVGDGSIEGNSAVQTENKSEKDRQSADTGSSENGGENKAGNKSGPVSIEPQLLLDQSGVTITAQKYVTDDFWGDGIQILIENHSGRNVTVGCTALIVNDYMISDLFAVTVADGKKDQSTVYFLSGELKAAGIETIGKIEIYFHIYDSDSWDNIYDSECVTIKTSAYDYMDSTPNDMGQELYNAGGIRIVGKEVDENSFWGTAVLLYIENNSGRNIGVSCKDLSVNDYMMTPLLASTIYSGRKSIDDITIFSSDLEENGITRVEWIDFSLHIYDSNTYGTIMDTSPIRINTQ